MALLDFFSPRRKPDIQALVEQGRTLTDAASELAFVRQVKAIFDPLLDSRLPPSNPANGPLRSVVLWEMGGLIQTLVPSDTHFTANYESVLDDLITVCRWKTQLDLISPKEAAASDTLLQEAIKQYIIEWQTNHQGTRNHRLTKLLQPEDYPIVAQRTLRAFVAGFKRNPEGRKTLFWLRNKKVGIRFKNLHEYFFEQVSWWVYLFRDPNEAAFIDEALSHVRAWVRRRVYEEDKTPGPEVIAGINDIISQVQYDFVKKTNRFRANPDSFYLDAGLTTHLIGYVKRRRDIGKLLLKLLNPPVDDENLSDPDTEDNSDDWSDDHPDDEDYRLPRLRQCMGKLTEEEQLLINAHYDPFYGNDVPFSDLADRFKKTARSLEGIFYRSLEKLRECIGRNGVAHYTLAFNR